MKPIAKKGLIVVGVVYLAVVIAMIVALVRRARPSAELDLPGSVQQALETVRADAYEVDPEHVRASAITEKEATRLAKELLAAQGSIINVNYTIVLQILNFGVLLLFLYGVLWDPLLQMLDERRRHVAEELDTAADRRQQAEQLREKRQTELQQLREERGSIIAAARSTAETERSEIVRQARQEGERLLDQSRDRLGEEVRRARLALQEEVADLATRVAARVLEREVKPEDHQHIIAEMTESMSLGADAEPGDDR